MSVDASKPDRGLELVPLEGEIDLHESPNLRERLNPLIDQRSPRVHLDMSRVSYVDSSALAVFIDAMQRIQSYGGEFALVAIGQSVHKILEIARLDQVFKIYPGPTSAAATAV